MVRHLRFKRKLQLFLLLILAAFGMHAVQAVWHYRANQDSWDQEHQTRKIAILVHKIERNGDHAHQEVEYFLRTKDPEVADQVVAHLQTIPVHLNELVALGAVGDSDRIEQVRVQVNLLLELFERIRDKLIAIGLNENSGEHGHIRRQIHRVEEKLRAQKAFELLSSMLQLRRHEKDFIERRQLVYVEKFHAEVERFDARVQQHALTPDERSEVRTAFEQYIHGFYAMVSEQLVATEWIEQYRARVVDAERAIRALVEVLDEVYARSDAEQRALLFDQFVFSQSTVLAILLIISLLMAVFQWDLLRAIHGLKDAAQQVAEGSSDPIQVERRDEIGELAGALRTMQERLTARHRELEGMVRELKQSEQESAHALDLRTATTTILQQSLSSLSLEEVLRSALESVLSIPWLGVEPRGAVFLFNEQTQQLELTVAHRLSPILLKLCQSVPLGHCLCGRAGAFREVVMSYELDARHETRFEGMRPHGHYCVPMVSDQKLMGVLNVYLAAGHMFDHAEVEFLLNIANTLAGLISRRRAEEELTRLLATLDARVVERTQRLNEKIRELEATRHELIASEKLASLGRLVAGIAHEVNTPIGVSYSAATQLLEECRAIDAMLAQDEVDVESLLTALRVVGEVSVLVVRNLHRASELIKSFKRASIDQSSEAVRDYKVCEVVGDVLMSLSNAFKKTAIEIRHECPEGLRVIGIPGYLNQILTNLLLNSLTHGFDRGSEAGMIHLRFALVDGMLEFTYADTGAGMSEEVQAKAFEPFFTTNRKAGGSGLGLYICYNLITTKLRGSIQLRSAPGQGVCFECRWPVDTKQ
ncbi:MAG: GAF domain-containing protein [Magnetococcales bacterium]|nr:GAF domain-containing protein [Magnetococcales bacterium]